MVIHLLHVRLSLAFSAQCLTENINLSFVHFTFIPPSLLNLVLDSISTISSVYFLWVVWGTCPQCWLLIPGQCSRVTGCLEDHEVPAVTPGLLHVKPGYQDLSSHPDQYYWFSALKCQALNGLDFLRQAKWVLCLTSLFKRPRIRVIIHEPQHKKRIQFKSCSG